MSRIPPDDKLRTNSAAKKSCGKPISIRLTASEEDRLLFYESFAHNLTVAVRFVWADDRRTEAEKVEQMKWVNEIQHRVTAKITVLRRRTHEWTEEDFGSMVAGYTGEHPAIRRVVDDALWRSLPATGIAGPTTL